jgi:hypothetical protein
MVGNESQIHLALSFGSATELWGKYLLKRFSVRDRHRPVRHRV